MKKMTRYECKKTMNDNRTRDLGDQDGLQQNLPAFGQAGWFQDPGS